MKQLYIKTIAFLFGVVAFSGTMKATDYYLKAAGALNVTGSWGVNPDGSGANPVTLNASHVWHFANRTAATLTVNFSISTSTIIIEPGFNLTVSGGPPGGGKITGKLDITSTGSLTIGNNISAFVFGTLDANSTVIYNFSANTVKFANYGNLVIAASTSLNASVNVFGILTINGSRVLTMNGFGIFFYGNAGTIAGAGTLTGDANAFVDCEGGNGGNNGTFNFTAGGQLLDYFYVFYDTPADFVKLGTDLTITLGSIGTFWQAFGSIDLNGRTVTVNSTADASFAANNGDGFIIGSSGGLVLKGSVGAYSGTTDLFMDPSNNTLKVLGLNNAAATLDISNALIIADSLSVQNGVLNTNSNVTLHSTSGLKGRLGKLTGTLNGNLSVETFALGGSTGWAQLGISGITGQTFNNWYGQIPMTIEGSATGVTSAGGYYFESVQGWNEADAYGYDTTITVGSPITPGQGYWVYLGNGASSTTNMIWTVSGTPVTGVVNMPLTNSAQTGYNLIANPFASPISWTRLRNGNASVSNATYIYNADGPYVTFVNGVGTNGGSDVIAMGQGFYVQATANTALNADEDTKSSGNTVQLFKPSGTDALSSVGQVFKLKLNGPNSDFDETAFRFHSSATSNFDLDWDARKLFATPGYAGYPGAYSKYTSISSKSGNEDYSVNSLQPLTTQSVSIPVLVKVMATGSYTIAPLNLQDFTNPSCFVLRDNLLNVNHPLSNGPYVCTINDTTSAPRFQLQICAQSIPTSVSNAPVSQNSLLIAQDQSGAFVKTSFSEPTKAVISVYNIVGQQLMDNITVNGTETTTYLNLNLHNQVVLVRVATDKESTVKKIVLH